MNWGADASGRYERWRWQWLVRRDSQALATFRWHGLAKTLALTAPRPAPVPAAEPASDRAARDAAPPVAVAEAARQIRQLLHAPEGASHA